jgi:hypothetical protein
LSGAIRATVHSIIASSTFYQEVVGLVPPNHGAKEDTAQPTVLADGIEVFDVRSENFDRLTLRRVEYRTGCAGWPANARDRVWEVMW